MGAKKSRKDSEDPVVHEDLISIVLSHFSLCAMAVKDLAFPRVPSFFLRVPSC
ncbi:MAG: hypothetical protein AABM64_02230 [Pseudomonadota bacterium]